MPGNNSSVGKSKRSRTTHGNKWLRSALTECAWAASRKNDCFLKEKVLAHHFEKAGKPAPAVVVEVAHALLRLIYEVLKTGQPYKNRQAEPLKEHQKQRLITHYVRRLGKLGGTGVEETRGAVTASLTSTPSRRPRGGPFGMDWSRGPEDSAPPQPKTPGTAPAGRPRAGRTFAALRRRPSTP
jgi:transposase IS116/IS110/IS902 family protein